MNELSAVHFTIHNKNFQNNSMSRRNPGPRPTALPGPVSVSVTCVYRVDGKLHAYFFNPGASQMETYVLDFNEEEAVTALNDKPTLQALREDYKIRVSRHHTRKLGKSGIQQTFELVEKP